MIEKITWKLEFRYVIKIDVAVTISKIITHMGVVIQTKESQKKPPQSSYEDYDERNTSSIFVESLIK